MGCTRLKIGLAGPTFMAPPHRILFLWAIWSHHDILADWCIGLEPLPQIPKIRPLPVGWLSFARSRSPSGTDLGI